MMVMKQLLTAGKGVMKDILNAGNDIYDIMSTRYGLVVMRVLLISGNVSNQFVSDVMHVI